MAQEPSFWQKFEIFKKGDIGHLWLAARLS